MHGDSYVYLQKASDMFISKTQYDSNLETVQLPITKTLFPCVVEYYISEESCHQLMDDKTFSGCVLDVVQIATRSTSTSCVHDGVSAPQPSSESSRFLCSCERAAVMLREHASVNCGFTVLLLKYSHVIDTAAAALIGLCADRLHQFALYRENTCAVVEAPNLKVTSAIRSFTKLSLFPAKHNRLLMKYIFNTEDLKGHHGFTSPFSSDEWINDDNDDVISGSNNVILTSYFKAAGQRFRHMSMPKPPDVQFLYIKDFYWSVVSKNLSAVIFHNGLDSNYVRRLATDKIKFVHTSLGRRSPNDERFFLYLDYLQRHPEIRRVVLADIRDVRFSRDPFHLLDLTDDFVDDPFAIHVGLNAQNTLSEMKIVARAQPCLGFRYDSYLKAYNAGAIAGARDPMLALLGLVTRLFGRLTEQEMMRCDCNMGVVNYVLHNHPFVGHVYEGWPFTSRFKAFKKNPLATYIVHK